MRKKIIYVIIIIVAILQSLIIGVYKPKNNKDELIKVNSIENKKNVKYIEEIETELKIIKNLNINSYTRIDDKWKINCYISGKKEELVNFLNNLKDYKIQDYNFIYDKENIVLNLELISK